MSNRTLTLAALTLALLVFPATAQLSGAYTVDNNTPTGGTNYNTLPEAATALAAGVSGPVVFTVAPSVTPYVGFAITAAVTGASSTNTITFVAGGPGVFLSGVAATFTQVVRLSNAAVSTTTFTGPSYITIDGFDITVPASGAGVIVGGSQFGCVVRNCYVHGTNTGAGIAIVNSNNCVVENNEVANTAATPGSPGSATYSGGISIYYVGSGNVINRNKVHDCTQQGIFMGSSGNTTAPANVTCTNNFVWNCVGAGTYVGGIAIRRLSGTTVVANNSVWMAAGTSQPGMNQMGAAADPQPSVIANNIIKHDGTGPCFRFEATTIVPSATFDNNLYNPGPSAFVGAVGATTYATLAAWQAVAAPNLAGKELATTVGDPLFTAANDLHISASSPAFNTGMTVAAVAVDIDNQPRPMSGVYDRGADETPGSGIFANFSATPTTGPAALNVNFTDTTFTSDPSGVQTWAWDFQNDGINDAFTATPSFNYVVPGVYSVKLTVTDLINGSSSITKTNFINVGPYIFDAQTTPGAGDLTVIGIPGIGVPTATSGFMFVSFTPPVVLGSGPFFGLIPDSFTWSIVATPASVGNLLHWVLTPGNFPNVPLVVPPGVLLSLVGLTADFIQIDLTAAQTIANISNLDRITF